MKKLNTEYWKKLLETVAFSNGEISLYELVQKEHRHFHPGGDPFPSREDDALTMRMKEAAQLINMNLCDHIIIGGESYYSYKEQGNIWNGSVTNLVS